MAAVAVAALVVAAVASVAGAAVQGVSAEQQAQAASDAAKAEGLLRKAESERSARQLRKQHARDQALARVMFGKAGVVASQGSALDVLAENAGEMELEAVVVEQFGANALAFGQAAATNYSRQGRLAAAGAGISGVGQVASIVGAGAMMGAGGGGTQVSQLGSGTNLSANVA